MYHDWFDIFSFNKILLPNIRQFDISVIKDIPTNVLNLNDWMFFNYLQNINKSIVENTTFMMITSTNMGFSKSLIPNTCI